MKIFQLISSAGHYGAEAMLLNLSKSLEDLGCEVTIGIFNNKHQPNLEVAERAAAWGLCTERVECNGRVDLAAIRRLRSILRSRAPEVLHLHGYKADVYGGLAARALSIPTVATCHNWVGGTLALSVYNRLDFLALRYCRFVAAVSDPVASRLRHAGLPPENIAVIPNGIEMSPFQSATPSLHFPGRLVIGMVARLDMDKGFQPLLQAFVEVANQYPNVLLVVAGEGPARSEIEQLASSLRLQDHLILLGHRSDIPELYASFNIFVLPSLNEGMPITVLEAFASGLPVVASRVGALPLIIRDGVNGLLVEPDDSNSLAVALLKMIREPELRAEMGRNGREMAKTEYTSQSMAQKYLELYRAAGAN